MRQDKEKKLNLGSTVGSATGGIEHTTVAGGWAGTDDATSTAPSDSTGNPPVLDEDHPVDPTSSEVDRWIQQDDDSHALSEALAEELQELSEMTDRATD